MIFTQSVFEVPIDIIKCRFISFASLSLNISCHSGRWQNTTLQFLAKNHNKSHRKHFKVQFTYPIVFVINNTLLFYISKLPRFDLQLSRSKYTYTSLITSSLPHTQFLNWRLQNNFFQINLCHYSNMQLPEIHFNASIAVS